MEKESDVKELRRRMEKYFRKVDVIPADHNVLLLAYRMGVEDGRKEAGKEKRTGGAEKARKVGRTDESTAGRKIEDAGGDVDRRADLAAMRTMYESCGAG